MSRKDLRTFLDDVERDGTVPVERVTEPVQRDRGLSAVVKLAETRGNPVFVFENVRSSKMPVVAGLYACRHRAALALGQQERDVLDHYLQCLKGPVPTVQSSSAPVKDVRLLGTSVDLGTLPIITHAPLDSGPYITAGVGLARDPDSGAINAGIYRLQILGPDRFGVYAGEVHDLRHIIDRAQEAGQKVPFAVVVGHHPAFTLASQSDVPRDVDSLQIAGALLGEPLSVVAAETVDLDVPAYAEIVIEGQIDPAEVVEDGPFGEFTYYYNSAVTPVCSVTAITHRQDAYYVDIHNTHVEHLCMGIFPEGESRLLKRIREVTDTVHAVHIPTSGAKMHANIALTDPPPGHARAALDAALNHEKLLIKHAIVVDDDIDPSVLDEVLWALSTRFQADRDMVVFTADGSGPDDLDPSTLREDGRSVSSKVGFDATRGPAMARTLRADVTR